tara:strand:+ start:2620 stop:5115 length:2496 start_codon:yes stop_codon:yes gene_type:complete
MYCIKFLNRQKVFLIIFLLTRGFYCVSQVVRVNDMLTQEPLSDVYIFNENKKKYTSTNNNGIFDLNIFSVKDTLTLGLIGYDDKKITVEDIISNSNLVEMSVNEKKLSEIVLSVARTALQSEKISQKVEIINKNLIIKNSPATGAEVLLLAPSVRVQKSQGGGGSPVIRGFEANRVLLVVDGVRMNNGIFRSGHLQNAITVDPNSLERVEIIYGSSSVGYGSDALGGVVHYYTKTPKINNAQKLTNFFSSTFNSARQSFVYHLNSEASFNKSAIISSFTFSKFGDILMGKNRQHGFQNWGLVNEYSSNSNSMYFETPSKNNNPNIQKNSGYSQVDFLQKIVFTLPKEKQLLINLQFSNSSNIPRFDKLNEMMKNNLRFAEWNYGPQKRLLISPQLKIFPKKKYLYKGTIVAAYQWVKESRIQRRFESQDRINQNENVNIYSLNADFEMPKTRKISVVYGFELVGNKIKSDAFRERLSVTGNTITQTQFVGRFPSRYPNNGSSYFVSAAYSNLRMDLNTKSSVSLGARYTSTKIKASWINEQFLKSRNLDLKTKNNALTGSISSSYRPNKNLKLNILFSTGFRSPNIDDIGKIRENRGILIIPNPELKPEYVYNLEGGLTFSNDDIFSIEGRFFNSNIKNYIGRIISPFSEDLSNSNIWSLIIEKEKLSTQINQNIGNARIYGVSIDGMVNFLNGLTFMGNINLTDSTLNKQIGLLPSILPLFGNFRINYKKEKFNLTLSNNFSGRKLPQDYSRGGEDKIEETPIINVKKGNIMYYGSPKWSIYSITGGFDHNEKIRTSFSIENIFDLHYKEFASGISAPGRSIILNLNLKF